MKNMIRIAIDFGSTVSALGWQMYQTEDGSMDPEPMSEQVMEKFPTVLVKKEENPQLLGDQYGNDALRAIRNDPGIVYHSGFKEALYNPDSPKHKDALADTAAFFGFLREYFEANSGYSVRMLSEAEKKVVYTTPMAFDLTAAVKSALVQAGFTEENGYSYVEKLDEARALLDLSLQQKNSPLRAELEGSLKDDPDMQQILLVIDMGGLTTDINVSSFSFDKTDKEIYYKTEDLGNWPCPDDYISSPKTSIAGGEILDAALKTYLVKHGVLDSGVADQLIKKRGYLDFRRWKEISNDYFWKYGRTQDSAAALGGEYFPDAGYGPPAGLSPETFLKEVAAPYIRVLTEGIRAAIRNADSSPRKPGKITEESIDWIFLTGGASNAFFVKRLLLDALGGEFGLPLDFEPYPGYKPLHFSKVQKQPGRLICTSGSGDGTLSCVRGALVDKRKARLSGVADYDLVIRGFSTAYTPSLLFESSTIPILRVSDPLPKEAEFSFGQPYTYKTGMTEIWIVPEIVRKRSKRTISSPTQDNRLLLEQNKKAKAADVVHNAADDGIGAVAEAIGENLRYVPGVVGEVIAGAFGHLFGRNDLGPIVWSAWRNYVSNANIKPMKIKVGLPDKEISDMLDIKGICTVDRERHLDLKIVICSKMRKQDSFVLEWEL